MEPNPIPLADASWVECCARMAFRMIESDYFLNPDLYQSDPAGRIQQLADEYYQDGAFVLSGYLNGYALALIRQPHIRLVQQRAAFIERARAGRTWRETVMPAYKQHRRH